MHISGFPILRNEYALICRHENSVIYALYSDDEVYSKPEFSYTTLNKTAAEILCMCDGTNKIENIVNTMSQKYAEDKDTVLEFVTEFLTESLQMKHIDICETILSNAGKANIYGNFSLMTPINACVEITKKCPLFCKHCFNDSGIARNIEMTTEEIFVVLDKLSSLGVQKIMFTGGEPTYRPDFISIIEYAQSRFVAISIVSNGYCLTSDLALSLSKFKKKIVVQISVDGTEEHHNYIRGVNNSFELAIHAVKELRKNGVLVTVASTLNSFNFNDMEDIADIAYNAGAYQLSFAITTDQGRARSNKLSYNINVEELVNRALALKESYRGRGMFINIDDDTLVKLSKDQSFQCGAGINQVTIRENGDIAPCICFFYSYGNILKDELIDIFSPNNISQFEKMPIPSLALCGSDCNELDNCNQCPARAYDAKKTNCIWKEKFEMIKKR